MKIKFNKNDKFVKISLRDNDSPYIMATKTFFVYEEQNTNYRKFQHFDLGQFEKCKNEGIIVLLD